MFRNLSQVLEGAGKPEGSKYTFNLEKIALAPPSKSNLYAQALAFAWLYAGGRPTSVPEGQWSILHYALERIDSTRYGSRMVRDLNHCLTDINMVALFFGDAFIGGREGSYKKDDKDTPVKLEGSQTFEAANCMDVFISKLLDKHHLKDVASLDALALLQYRIKWVGIVDKMLLSQTEVGGYDIVPILFDLFVHALPVGLEDAVMLPYGFANADGGHAMSLSLTRLSEKSIRLKVFNTGAGVQYHISNMLGSKAQALPYIQYDDIPHHLFLESIFFHSFARIQNTQFREKDVVIKDEQIYEGLFAVFEPYRLQVEQYLELAGNDSSALPFRTPQRSGTCTVDTIKIICDYFLDYRTSRILTTALNLIIGKEVIVRNHGQLGNGIWTFVLQYTARGFARRYMAGRLRGSGRDLGGGGERFAQDVAVDTLLKDGLCDDGLREMISSILAFSKEPVIPTTDINVSKLAWEWNPSCAFPPIPVAGEGSPPVAAVGLPVLANRFEDFASTSAYLTTRLAYFKNDYRSLGLGKNFMVHYLVEMVLQLPLCNADDCTWQAFGKDHRKIAIATLETLKELMLLNSDGMGFGTRTFDHEMAHKIYFQKLYLIAWYIASELEATRKKGVFLIKQSSPDVSRVERIRQNGYWRAYDHIVEQKTDELFEEFSRLSKEKRPLFDYTRYDRDASGDFIFPAKADSDMNRYLDGLVNEMGEENGPEIVRNALKILEVEEGISDRFAADSPSLQKAAMELGLINDATKMQFQQFYLLSDLAYYSQLLSHDYGAVESTIVPFLCKKPESWSNLCAKAKFASFKAPAEQRTFSVAATPLKLTFCRVNENETRFNVQHLLESANLAEDPIQNQILQNPHSRMEHEMLIARETCISTMALQLDTLHPSKVTPSFAYGMLVAAGRHGVLQNAFKKAPTIVHAFYRSLASSFERVLATLGNVRTDNDVSLDLQGSIFEPKPFFLSANLLLQVMIVKLSPTTAEEFRERLQRMCGPRTAEKRAALRTLFDVPTGVRIYLAAMLASYGHNDPTSEKERREMKALAKALYTTTTDPHKVAFFFPLEWAAEESLLRHLEELRHDCTDKVAFPSKSVSNEVLNVFTGMRLGIGSDLDYSTYVEQHNREYMIRSFFQENANHTFSVASIHRLKEEQVSARKRQGKQVSARKLKEKQTSTHKQTKGKKTGYLASQEGTHGHVLRSEFTLDGLKSVWLQADNSCFSIQLMDGKEARFPALPTLKTGKYLLGVNQSKSEYRIFMSDRLESVLSWKVADRLVAYRGTDGLLVEGRLLDPEAMQKGDFYAQRLDPSPHQVLAIADLEGKELQMVAYQKLLEPTSKAPVVFVKNDEKLVWNLHPDYELSPNQNFDMPKGFTTYLVVLVGKHAKVLVPWMSHGDVVAKKTEEKDFFIEIIDAEQTTILVDNRKGQCLQVCTKEPSAQHLRGHAVSDL